MKEFLDIEGLLFLPLGTHELRLEWFPPDLMLVEVHQRTNHDPQDRDCPKTKENLFYEPD